MKKIIARVVSILLALYLAYFFTGIVVPKMQIFIDTEDAFTGNAVSFSTYKNDKTVVQPDENGQYVYSMEYAGRKYDVAVNVSDDGGDISCKINDRDSRCVPVFKYTNYEAYSHVYCVPLSGSYHLRYFVFAVFFVSFCAMLLLLAKEVIGDNGEYTHVMTFSDSAYKCLGKKTIAVSFIVTLISLVLYKGCDLDVISQTIILKEKGVDIYQLFAALNKAKGVELFMWQYNGAMLAGYDLWSRLFSLSLFWYNPSSYHWIQVFEYKIFNMILYNLLVLSIISFLIDSNLLDKSKVKRVYYLSVFNPLTFYVAIWFIQFDILPAYLITLGMLLLFKRSDKVATAAVLLAFGLATKDTMLFFIPSFFVAFFFLLLKEPAKRKRYFSFSIMFFVLYAETYILPKLMDTPIAKAFHKLPQAQRAWWTVVTYIDNAVYLYLSIFMLVVCFVLGVRSYRLSVKTEDVVRNLIYVMAAIVCAFSFAIIPTPAFYIVTAGAFVLLYADSEDLFQALLYAALGMIMVVTFMFAREGDITGSLQFFNITPVFTYIGDKMNAAGEGVKWNSILHTVSQAGMFCFVIIFLRKANEVLGRDDKVL